MSVGKTPLFNCVTGLSLHNTPQAIENEVSFSPVRPLPEPISALQWEHLRSLGFREGVPARNGALTGLLLTLGLGSLASEAWPFSSGSGREA